MIAKFGEILLIAGIVLFVVGAIGLILGFLPQSAIVTVAALALIFVGAGASIKRRTRNS